MAANDWPEGHRVAGIAGIAFALLPAVTLFAVFPAVGPAALPPLGATPAMVAAYHASSGTGVLIGNYLGILAVIPGLVKLAYLSALIRKKEPADGWLWLLVFGAGMFMFGLGALVLVAYNAIPFSASFGLTASAKALSDLGQGAFAFLMLAVLALTLSVSWAILKTRALPRWVAMFGIVASVVMFIASLGAIWTLPFLVGGGPMTNLTFLVFLTWFASIDVVLLREW